jgi:hypothetical protein
MAWHAAEALATAWIWSGSVFRSDPGRKNLFIGSFAHLPNLLADFFCGRSGRA